MYRGKHNKSGAPASRRRLRRPLLAAAAVVLILGAAIGGTVAYLVTGQTSITNTFTPAEVKVEIEETFDSSIKNNVTIKNTGNTSAYIRAAVVATWQNDRNEIYATAPVEGTDYTVTWTMSNWVKYTDGFYYYTSIVSPGNSTGELLTGCGPVEGKTPDGYHLVVEVLAQAIQADNEQSITTKVVGESWGVTITDGSVTAYTTGGAAG